jgi:PAS domain S-box-containing protein
VVFSEKLSVWRGNGQFLEAEAPLFNTLEMRRIIDVFNKKTEEINAYIDELSALNTELEVRQSLYRDLVENVDEIIYSLDAEGKITSINRAFEQLLERDRNRMMGRSMMVLAAKDGQEEMIRQKFKYVKERHEKVTFNYRATDVNMNIRYFKITWIPQLDEFGGLKQVLGTQTEITELINTQASLRRIFENEKRKLESIVDAKNEALSNVLSELIEKEKLASLGHLVSGVSHEINTPLGVSVLANSYLEKESKETRRLLASGELTLVGLNAHLDKIDETTAILNANLNRAVALVKSFKEIAVRQNIEELETFNVRQYIDMVMLSLKHEYKNRAISFNVDCPEDLTLSTYPGALSQILTNLIMNALNHAYDPGGWGTIKISVSKTEDVAQIVFEDDGKGMPAEVVERIYEPFFTTNRGSGGSGLGLNIVYNIVTGQLEGRIKCTSVPSKGTRFEIEFSTAEKQ